ncbi:hypothetical protein HK103_002561, partial [Boothiomyces macroporosus]
MSSCYMTLTLNPWPQAQVTNFSIDLLVTGLPDIKKSSYSKLSDTPSGKSSSLQKSVIKKEDKNTKAIKEERKPILLEDTIDYSVPDKQNNILQSKTIDDLDNFVEQETSLIIEQFQKLVIKAKTEKLANEQDRLDKQTSRQNKTENVLGGLIEDLSEKSHNLEKELNQNEFMKQTKGDIETLIKKNDSLINSDGD